MRSEKWTMGRMAAMSMAAALGVVGCRGESTRPAASTAVDAGLGMEVHAQVAVEEDGRHLRVSAQLRNETGKELETWARTLRVLHRGYVDTPEGATMAPNGGRPRGMSLVYADVHLPRWPEEDRHLKPNYVVEDPATDQRVAAGGQYVAEWSAVPIPPEFGPDDLEVEVEFNVGRDPGADEWWIVGGLHHPATVEIARLKGEGFHKLRVDAVRCVVRPGHDGTCRT